MNPRATIALFLATLLVVGALVWLRHSAPTTRDADELRRYAAVFDPDAITGIDISRGNETVSLRREPGSWRLTAPVTDRASPEDVDRLLTALRFLTVRDRMESPDQAVLTETGVASPRIRIDLRGPRDLRIDLGAGTPLPGEIFARVGGESSVLRVPDTIVGLAGASVDSFRDPRLTDFVADDIEKFTVRRADGEMSLRLERGRWTIEKPVNAPADPAAVRAFLEPLLGLRITRFAVPSPEAAGALPGQTASISLTPRGGGDALNLEVTAAPGESETVLARFSPRNGTIEVDASAQLLFTVSPEALRNRSLGHVEPDAVDRIVAESGTHRLELRRDEQGWIASGNNARFSDDAVQELINAFNRARISAFHPGLDAGEAGLEPPQQRLAFYAWLSENTPEEPAGGHLIAVVELGADAGEDAVHAKSASAESPVTIPAELAGIIGDWAGQSGTEQHPAGN